MKKLSANTIILFAFVAVKLGLHFFTYNNYELHRDALLYYSLGEHPAWGYVSVPPFTPLISWFSTALFGANTFALRLFPALIGALSMVVIAGIVRELKGGRMALMIALTAFLLSPAYLRSNSLFQPVTFNQFFWLLSAYSLIRLIRTQNGKLWLLLFLVWGVGFMNKYSIAFFIVAALAGLLLTPQRKLLLSKYFFSGGVLGLLIIFPNLLWQYNHNWPLVSHMTELNKHQFVNVSEIGFIIDQVMMNLPGVIVWGTGLLAVLFTKPLKPYRSIGYLYLLVLLTILLLNGKSYYTLGLYTMLFAIGGYVLEKYAHPVMQYAVLGLMLLISLPLIPFSLSVLDYPGLAEYSEPIAKFTNRWEDGKVHAIPQDFADMTGWQELA
ncbi:MAG: glycosyltransferase family 39 protein, partial [Bacteroidota bacterium]